MISQHDWISDNRAAYGVGKILWEGWVRAMVDDYDSR